MDSHDERLERLQSMMRWMYAIVVQVLAELPIPVAAPRLGNTPDQHATALEALEAAWRILDDQPMSTQHRRLVDLLITEWANAYDVIKALESEVTGLRLAGAERQIRACQFLAEKISDLE